MPLAVPCSPHCTATHTLWPPAQAHLRALSLWGPFQRRSYTTHFFGAVCAQRCSLPRLRCCAAVQPQWWCPSRKALWPVTEPLRLASGRAAARSAAARCARRAPRPAGEMTRRTTAFPGTRRTTTCAASTSRTWGTQETRLTLQWRGTTRWKAQSHATATPAATLGVYAASASAGTS